MTEQQATQIIAALDYMNRSADWYYGLSFVTLMIIAAAVLARAAAR